MSKKAPPPQLVNSSTKANSSLSTSPHGGKWLKTSSIAPPPPPPPHQRLPKRPLKKTITTSLSLQHLAPITTNTPLYSCNISPSESCRVSCDLNPDDHLFNWSTELSSFTNNHPTKKSWSKKLKLIKHSFLRQKLKASRAYLKSSFSKSVCSYDSSAKANCKARVENLSIGEASWSKNLNSGNKIPLGHISRASYPRIDTIMKYIKDKEGIEDNIHRRSFSGAIKRHSPTKCLSSSSSDSSSGASSQSSSFLFNSNGFQEPHFLRRSSSVTEIEMSIDASIAHCKKSQQIFHSRNSTRDSGVCSLSASRVHQLNVINPLSELNW